MEKVTENLDIYEEDLMDKALRLMAPGRLKPDELTVRMFMEKVGVSRHLAWEKLEDLVEQGHLTKRTVILEGKTCNAYGPGEGGWAKVIEFLQG